LGQLIDEERKRTEPIQHLLLLLLPHMLLPLLLVHLL